LPCSSAGSAGGQPLAYFGFISRMGKPDFRMT
jgi:hypothetical protein